MASNFNYEKYQGEFACEEASDIACEVEPCEDVFVSAAAGRSILAGRSQNIVGGGQKCFFPKIPEKFVLFSKFPDEFFPSSQSSKIATK